MELNPLVHEHKIIFIVVVRDIFFLITLNDFLNPKGNLILKHDFLQQRPKKVQNVVFLC